MGFTIEYLVGVSVGSMNMFGLLYVFLYIGRKVSKKINNLNYKFIIENLIVGSIAMLFILSNFRNLKVETFYIGWLINIFLSYRQIYKYRENN